MRKSLCLYFIICAAFILNTGISFAGQVKTGDREEVVSSALDQIQNEQGREDAMYEAIEEAQLKLIESTKQAATKKVPVVKEKKAASGGGFVFPKPHPYLNLNIMSDSNVEALPQAKSAMLYGVTPGVKLNYFNKGRSVNLDFNLPSEFYSTHKDQNASAINVTLLNNNVLGRSSTLSFYDHYFNNFLGEMDLGLDTNYPKNYWQNTFNTTWSNSFNRLSFNMGYTRIDADYEPSLGSVNDSAENRFNFHSSLRVAPKTQVVFDYTYDWVNYIHNPTPSLNYYYNEGSLGVSSILTSKLSGTLSFDRKVASYKESDNYQQNSYVTELAYRISDRSDLSLNYMYRTYRTTTPINRYAEALFGVEANHRFAFNPKLKLSLGYALDSYDYYKRNGSKNIHDYDITFTYAFRRWLDFSLDWAYKEASSNVDAEYKRTVIQFKTEAKF